MAGIRKFRYFEADVEQRIHDRFGFDGDRASCWLDTTIESLAGSIIH